MTSRKIQIQGLIFDLDGVLANTAELHYQAWTQLAIELGIPFSRADYEQMRGFDRDSSLRAFIGDRSLDEATARAWLDRKNTLYHNLIDRLKPGDTLPGVPDVIRQARAAGLRIGVGSASYNARPILDKLDLTHQFDAIGDAYTVRNTKPAPDVFMWVAGRLGLLPEQVIVFEDSRVGVEAALAGGFWTVGLGTSDVQRAHLNLPGLASVKLDEVRRYFEDFDA